MTLLTGTLLNSFSGCSNSAEACAWPLNIRYFPTLPLEFARPFGNNDDFDKNSRRGVSAPLAQSTTAFALWKCSRPPSSKYVTPVTRPALLTSIFLTQLFGRISHKPVFSASRMTVANVDDLAFA